MPVVYNVLETLLTNLPIVKELVEKVTIIVVTNCHFRLPVRTVYGGTAEIYSFAFPRFIAKPLEPTIVGLKLNQDYKI